MKMLKYICGLVLMVMPFAVNAQETGYEEEFEAFKQQTAKEFEEFKNRNDRIFYDFLRQTWGSVDLKASEMPKVKPKPVEMPKARTNKWLAENAIHIKEVTFASDRSEEPPLPELGVAGWNEHSQEVIRKLQVLAGQMPADDFRPLLTDSLRLQLAYYYANASAYKSFDFYGHSCNLYFDEAQLVKTDTLNERRIAEYWKTISQDKQSMALANQLLAYESLLELNDWAFLYLVRKASKVLYQHENDRIAFTWFVMVRSGFKAKIGYDYAGLYLLLPTSHVLYHTTFFEMEGRSYFVFDFDNKREIPESLKTYKEDHPANKRVVNLRFDKPFKQKDVPSYRMLKFEYDGVPYAFNISYHAGLVEFFSELPMTDFRVIFNCPLSQTSYQSLVKHLQPVLKDKKEKEAVNILLRFVQTAFRYKTDQEQFGQENYMFPEETLHFPYSDCEDRSVLFARLVKDLLGLEVIGLNYPDHVATAVRLNKAFYGDFVKYRGERFMVCDPTYENANLGMAMPKYKEEKVEVIDFDYVM